MSFEVRATADLDEFQQAFLAIGQYFGSEPNEERISRFAQSLPIERMHAARADGQIVGGAGAFPFELSVPGGSVRCAGVSVVGVYPTHRRRGVLRGMMRAQLDDVHDRGEPIAALWASEETIYGRFGYGLASLAGEIRLPREYAAYAHPFAPRGIARIAQPDEARELLPRRRTEQPRKRLSRQSRQLSNRQHADLSQPLPWGPQKGQSGGRKAATCCSATFITISV